ncbi:MAG: Hpt domain-containing protein, partial [Pseudomonadota bacterium]
MSEARQQAIHVVSDELGKTVNLARIALEDAVEGRSTRQALEKCADLLHEVGGVLKVVEIYGGALLSEEMEHTCRFLLQPRDKASMHEGLDALTRAMVQLPAYLERMVAGGRDVALVLLPLLNDLRAVRGQALLSESTILLLNRTPSEHVTVEQRGSAPSEDFVQLSRKVRPAFQLALLGLLKADQDSARPHLKKLRRMADALEQAAERDDVYRLWWVVGGVVDALLDGSLPISISIKRLLGQADRRIKRVIDAGLESFDKEPVADLLNSLLFYIARADEPGESVLAIRQAFGLTEPLPTQEEVDSVHGAMAGPSVALMQTVAAAIREDLTAVKDVLDVHMRTGEEDLGKLEPQIELLSKISDTLGVLGLGDARASVIAEVQKLRGMLVSGGGTPDHEALLSVAATLLSVEGSLERRLTQLVTPVEDTDRAPDSAEERQLGGVRSAVMRECIVNLARIKDTLTQAMEGKLDPVAVDAVPVLADGIQSGLSMLELTRARAVFAKLAAFVDTYLKAANQTLAADQLDRLADALVSVEYYMETIEAGRKEPGYMLDNAETCLSVLDDVRRDLERGAAEEAHEPTMVTRGLPAGAHSDTATVGDDLKGVHAPVVKNDTKNIDPELLELFIEEAKEEVRSIRRLLPQWHQDTADMDALITVRRSFHTLKGSGRMVGAERIGEYCWSIENLLNRVINRTLPVTPAMADFVADAAIAVPELIEQLETGIEPKIDVDLLALKAQAFADGDPKAADLTRASDVAAAPALEMDPVLYEIFAKEANGYLAAIGAFVDAADSTPAPITDAMHRACHTLHGSINTAGLDRAMPLSGALNQLARRVYDGRVGLDDDALALVNEAARTLDNIIHSVNDPVAEPPSVEDLTRRLEAKTAEIAHAQSTLVTEGINPPAEAVVDGSETDYEPTHVLTKLPGELQPVTAASELEAEENYDPEIAEIFTEEAAELLETADTALDAWSKRRDGDSLRELKRALHTLKGSANMAGIRAFGNLSHELETLLTALDDQRVNASTDIDHLLRHSFDTLHQMREVVLLGKQPSAMDDLEGTVRLAARGQIPAVDADAVPESETAPPVYRGLSTDELIEIPDEAPGIEDVTELDGELTGVLDAGSFNLDQVFTADTSGAEPGDSQLVDTMFGPHTETQQIGGGETAVDVAVGADGTAETPLDVDLEDMTGLEDTAITEGLDAQSLSSWSEPDDSNDDD